MKDDGRIVTLIKPHYESGQHRLDDDEARAICAEVIVALPEVGVKVIDVIDTPIRGGKGQNLEQLALVRRV